jgi:FdhE protein
VRASRQQRIARAAALATSDLTRFYHALVCAQETWSNRGELSVETFPLLLDFVEREAPVELADRARELRAAGDSCWMNLVTGYWRDGISAPEDEFFARAFLEPYAEIVCAEPAQAAPDTISRCPSCGRPPVVAALRQDFDGARRSLVCSFCLWEWNFRRILCPVCGEHDFDLLPSFHVDEYPHLRIEACDSCRSYIVCVDVSREPLAVPVVDDIAATSLHLWAREHGYNRLQPNLLGL